MKRIRIVLSIMIASAIVSLTSCEVDNYAAPDAGIAGTVTDAVTGQPLITEQPNGFQVYWEETSWSDHPQLESFWGKADGTFRNTKMFAATYRISLRNGPFLQPEAKEGIVLKSGTVTTVDFTVTPCVSFEGFTATRNGDEVTVTFTPKSGINSTDYEFRIFATDQTPYPGTNYSDTKFSAVQKADGTNTGDNPIRINVADLGKPITVKLTGYSTGGPKYWLRVGARCKASNSRYNLTEVKEL